MLLGRVPTILCKFKSIFIFSASVALLIMLAEFRPQLLVWKSCCCKIFATGILLSLNHFLICSNVIGVPSTLIVIGLFSSSNVTGFQHVVFHLSAGSYANKYA